MGLLDRLFGAKVAPSSVRDLDGFEAEVLGSAVPVIVDVWSGSCGPCRKLEPILVEVATRYAGRVKVVEIAAEDAEPELLSMLEVRATPTIVLYERGEEVGRATGYRPVEWFDQMIAAELDVVR